MREEVDLLKMPDERLHVLGDMYLLMCMAQKSDVLMRGLKPVEFHQFAADQNCALERATAVAARRKKQRQVPVIEYLPI